MSTPTLTRDLGAAHAARLAAGTPTDLTDTLADQQDFLVGVHSGLIEHAPAGYVVGRSVAVAFDLAQKAIAALVAATANPWVTAEAADAGEELVRAFRAGLSTGPVVLLRDGEVARRERAAFVRGAEYATNLAAVA